MGAKYLRNITKILKSASGVLFGRSTAGTGRGEELTPTQVRSLLSVYTVAQTDAAISTAVNNLIAGSPGLLDTLDELAAALGDDANFASTVTTALAGKVNTSDLSESVDDRVAALLVAGTNISLTYNDASGTLTVASTASGLSGSTGSTDNAVLRADGTGGSTAQSSLMIVNDDGTINVAASNIGSTSYVETITNTNSSAGFPVRNGLKVVVNGSGQTGDSSASRQILVEVYGVTTFYVGGGGAVVCTGSVTCAGVVSSGMITTPRTVVTANNTSTVTETIKAAASQTANLTEWQNSSGTVIASIDASGNVQMPISATTYIGSIGANITFAHSSFMSVCRSGDCYGTQFVGGANQGSYYLRNDITAAGFGWGAYGTTSLGSPDTKLCRNAAGVVEINNGTFGTFRDLIVRNLRMSAPTLVPASASATGSEGQIAWDANYLYVCTATNTWKRVAIATW